MCQRANSGANQTSTITTMRHGAGTSCCGNDFHWQELENWSQSTGKKIIKEHVNVLWSLSLSRGWSGTILCFKKASKGPIKAQPLVQLMKLFDLKIAEQHSAWRSCSSLHVKNGETLQGLDWPRPWRQTSLKALTFEQMRVWIHMDAPFR